MNDVDYQAVYSKKLSQRGEARYIIINVTTGEILDDAQGFGYKSKKKAYAGYYYKRNYAKEKNQNKAVEYWLHSHPEFCDELTYHVFAHFKEGKKEKLDENLVQMLLREFGLDAPCKINKLITVWEKLR
ncbi:hypothetical protein [Enterococcus cecorum]|uniref:hypothetical protein n=1 Tax=Enterococcus cecorum TaxID=44008 RepID=UPI000DEBE7AD|nr:hypothetical protein [Enterococcus cecorum]RBR32679.1 hypothetical protein EB08_00022 [Enterococcus cecorum]RBR37354.1 hypothetical protein EB26_00341 [Enterococcus cecorum]RBR39423.1 hypothetical protein EB31_00023 [Enterococcus cecorum]